MSLDITQVEELRGEVERLRGQLDAVQARLEEPEQIVRAIRDGEVDAFVVIDPQGERIYSLRSADVLYRAMVEEMQEGAVALDTSGVILYSNARFASFLKADRARLVGGSIHQFLTDDGRAFFDRDRPAGETRHGEIVLRDCDGGLVQATPTAVRALVPEGVKRDTIVYSLAEGPPGRVWVTTLSEAFVWERGVFTPLTGKPWWPPGWVTATRRTHERFMINRQIVLAPSCILPRMTGEEGENSC